MDSVITGYDDHTWYEANLMCFDGGRRVRNLDTLRRYIAERHDVFFLVGNQAPTCEEIALNMEEVAEWYKELMRRSQSVEANVRLWPHRRRDELEAIYLAQCDLLAVKLGMDLEVLLTCENKIWEYASAIDKDYQVSSSRVGANNFF
ncbi:hypothetical protein RvY_13449 [Ramazzottius varieornatus]|uniref:Uncharacterized protein n=1 Tax=Ramazzottius varieornatus TaxID=947166 RepID=A0A1D1VT72_RAMVA|nr:hypothetical protein RvY_13449 [Ramazzottius varieornatus]